MLRNNILLKTRFAIHSIIGTTQRKKLLLMVFYSLISAFLDVFGIASLVYAVNFITSELDNSLSNLIMGAIGVIAFFITKNFITTYLTKLQASFAFNEAQNQSRNLFRIIYNQDGLFFRNTETGSLVSDVMYVPGAFSNGVIMGYITLITEICVSLLMLIFLSITAFYISLLVFICIAPAAYLSYRSIKNKVERLGEYRNSQVKAAQDALIQAMDAQTDATVYDRKKYFESDFDVLQGNIYGTDAKVYTFNSIPARLMELFAVMALCIIYIYHNKFEVATSLPFDMTLFIASAFRLLPSVNRSLGSMLRIKNHWFSVNVLQSYLKKQKIQLQTEPISFNKSIRLENLKFRFENKEICNIESFEIKHGDCIGIFGNTGEGKSTVLHLLLQLIPSSEGKIIIDDIVLNDNRISSYRNLFSFVKQDVFIFNGSLIENITFGIEGDANMDSLNQIVLKLELNKIEHLFSNPNSNAGEAGSKLSGGQKKLISLARALYFNHPILVLDEIFASFDSETLKNAISVLLDEKKKGKTILIVSHQRSAFEICDHIFEFKNGTLKQE